MEDSSLPGTTLAPGVWAEASALRFHYARSGGPGGQNVNKVNSKAELRIKPEDLRGLHPRALERLKSAEQNRITVDGDLLISADTSRSQEANRRDCMERLRTMIVAAQYEPKVRRKSRPTRGSVQRRLEEKKAHSKKKQERGRGFGY